MENQMKNESNPEVSKETRENPSINPEKETQEVKSNPEAVKEGIIEASDQKENETVIDKIAEDIPALEVVEEIVSDTDNIIPEDIKPPGKDHIPEKSDKQEAVTSATEEVKSNVEVVAEVEPTSTENIEEKSDSEVAESMEAFIPKDTKTATDDDVEPAITKENITEPVNDAIAEKPEEVKEAGTEKEVEDTPVAETAKEEIIQPESSTDKLAADVLKTTDEAIPEDVTEATSEEKKSKTADSAAAKEEAEKAVHVRVEVNEEEIEEKYNELSRDDLVDALETALDTEDINSIKTRVAILKVSFHKKTREEKERQFQQFLADGGTKEEYVMPGDPQNERFNEAFKKYKSLRSKWLAEQDKIKAENLVAKNHILEELRLLISSEETLKKTYDEFKTLQERWKGIGIVPREELNNLWQSYHFLVEKFFDKVKINRELKDLDLKKNLEAKIELCEKVEELLLETSIIRSFRQLQKYHQNWKEIGPVPQDKSDEIWDRFKSATDKINLRRREHYEELQQNQGQNLLAKIALCDKAEELLAKENNNIRQWQDSSDQMSELFKVWRTIGPAPRENNDEIWDRFRSYNETFYNAKKDYFNKLKEEQINNYNLKLDLANQAEALKSSNDWRKTSQDLINLQKQWKEIGPVPRKHSDKIWKRFRAACDEFFNAKSDYFSNIHDHEEKNLESKKELIEKLKTQEFTDKKGENLKILNGFQREWMQIGHVPIRGKDAIQNEFRKLVDSKLGELQISTIEMDTLKFKSRIENIKDDREANRVVYKEKNYLQGKITRIKDDLNLWENNLGFLADSKQAQVLKDEFDKKINKAKQEMALLEAKLKMLRETL